MKICTLVLTYDAPLYNYFDDLRRKYLNSKQADYFFVYNGVDETKHNIGQQCYNFKTDIYQESGIPAMFDKFIDIINSGLLDEYDYIIRTNSSTFINIDKIKDALINSNVTENLYMGFFFPNWNFVSGACSIFSKDAINLIKHNFHLVNKYQEDDVAIGELMHRLNVPKTFLSRYSFESHIQDTHVVVPTDEEIKAALEHPQIRVRNNSNRDLIDKGIWNSIIRLIN